jgi:multiple sugar transport system substrate-binding protein
MALEDIKSPLPPRRFSSLYEPGEEEETPTVNNEAVASEPLLKPAAKPVVVSRSTEPDVKKGKSKALIYAVIGILVAVIIYLVFMVVIPALTTKKDGTITLTYWGLWEEPAVIEGLIADFESKNPGVKINYVRNQKVNYRTRLKTRLETTPIDGASEVAPDIFRIHSSWLPMFKNNLAKVPTDVATSVGLDSDFFEAFKNTIKINGSWQGIPLMYDGLSLFYNKDLIENAGVSLPKSWWDLEMAANKLTVRNTSGRITVAGVAMGLVDNVDHWNDILGLMLKQAGVDILAPDADNEKKLSDVLTYYTLFKTKNNVWDEFLPSSTEAFANGKLAFYFAPSWRVFNIEEMKIPTLRYGITTVPQLPTLADVPLDQANNEANLTNIHWATYWAEGVNVKSKNQAMAWKFLEYLATRESLEKMYTAASQIRAFGEIYPRKSMINQMNDNELTKPFVKAANDATGWYLSSRTFDEGLNDEMSKYFADAVNGLMKVNVELKDVMLPLRSGINQMMTKYSLK